MVKEARTTTAASHKSLKSASSTWQFIKEDFAAGHAHKAAGKPVVWSCALMDKELYHAMGIYGFYPEQYASLASVQRKAAGSEMDAVRYLRIAEQHGYSTDLCGYQRVGMGYVINGDLADGPLGGMPAPDLLVTTSSVCDVRMKWWEDMAQRLNVPMFILDRPERNLRYGRMEMPEPHEVSYYRSQLEDFIGYVQEVTGMHYDQDRLNECLDWSYLTNELRLEILELRKTVPSPMGAADGFATVYPGMYCHGTEKAYRFYLALRDEVKDRVQRGQGLVNNERFRLMFCGIPTWFNTSIFNYFEPLGGVFALDLNYPPRVWPLRMPEDPLTELAYRSLSEGTQLLRESRLGAVVNAREFKIDGVVINSVYTCRPVYLPYLEQARALEEELGIPSVVMDCDFVDERSYSEGQVRTRLDALAERIMIKKGIRG